MVSQKAACDQCTGYQVGYAGVYGQHIQDRHRSLYLESGKRQKAGIQGSDLHGIHPTLRRGRWGTDREDRESHSTVQRLPLQLSRNGVIWAFTPIYPTVTLVYPNSPLFRWFYNGYFRTIRIFSGFFGLVYKGGVIPI